MAMSPEKFEEVEPEELGDYVPALFARSLDDAEQYCQLLEDHDIPARVDEEYAPPREAKAKGKAKDASVAVLVPESLLEDARAFIAEIEELDALPGEEEDQEEDEDEQLESADELEEDPEEEEKEEKKEEEEEEDQEDQEEEESEGEDEKE